MFVTLVEKELKGILLSPKFVATFGVCSILLLLSVFIGIQEYRASVEQYETAMQLTSQEVREATSWWGFDYRAYRQPDPMQIFVSGVNYDIGRLSEISTREEVKLENSTYTDDTLFAVFRFIDFTFIVQVVLSLFAILFTYDAICGERESGTLKLTFSNAVARGQYMAAKFLGSWLGLTLPLLVPILLVMLIIMLMNIPMEGGAWAKVGMLVGASVLYFTFFVALGLFVSALTRRSNISFLILLVAWVVVVLIVPRAGSMLAGQLVPVPSVAEIESQKDRFSTDQRELFSEKRHDRWRDRMTLTQSMSREERNAYYAQNRAEWEEEDDEDRLVMEENIADHFRKLNEDLRNQKVQREELAYTISRVSPASAFQLTAMNLAGTSTDLKERYEGSMRDYQTRFADFVDQKREEEREQRMQSTTGRGGGRMRMMLSGGDESVDASEMPRFTSPEESLSESIKPSVIDLGLLTLFSIVAFAGAFVSFIRYDVR